MKKAFTLIELLIVVAIIAILAAIAVPNFLEAQTRAKVARVKNDQRSIATGLETYFVDNSSYPPSVRGTNITSVAGSNYSAGNINQQLANAAGQTAKGTSFNGIPTFHARKPALADPGPASITTPISYMTSYPTDPFADFKQATFWYHASLNGQYILWSPGPDGDESASTNLRTNAATSGAEIEFTNGYSQPSATLLAGPGGATKSYTYDPTNGTTSDGDVYRVK